MWHLPELALGSAKLAPAPVPALPSLAAALVGQLAEAAGWAP
jgi:hypothetical protein